MSCNKCRKKLLFANDALRLHGWTVKREGHTLHLSLEGDATTVLMVRVHHDTGAFVIADNNGQDIMLTDSLDALVEAVPKIVVGD